MKKLCKCDSKTLYGHVRRLAATGRRPRYICGLCGRASDERKQLCKPVKIARKSAKALGSRPQGYYAQIGVLTPERLDGSDFSVHRDSLAG